MQPCKFGPQHVASTIQDTNDLYLQRHSGWFHLSLHANYRSWLKGVSTSKGHDSISLKPKAIAKCGYPRSMAKAIKSYLGVEDLNTKDCALEGTKLFSSTNFPPSIKYNSQYQIDSTKHSILAQTLGFKEIFLKFKKVFFKKKKKNHIEESLNYVGHVWHTPHWCWRLIVLIPSTLWSMGFGSSMMTSSVLWVTTKTNMLWTCLLYPTHG